MQRYFFFIIDTACYQHFFVILRQIKKQNDAEQREYPILQYGFPYFEG